MAQARGQAPAAQAPVKRGPLLREDLVHEDPLLDCLLEVCRLHGQSSSRSALCAGLPLVNGRLTLNIAERAAARAGMATRLQRKALADLRPETLPAILVLEREQACVLLSIDTAQGTAQVLWPETGQGAVSMSIQALDEAYVGVTLFIRPHFRFDARTPSVRPPLAEHWFWGPVLAQKGLYRDVLWAAFLVNVFAMVFPLFSMNVYDRVVPNHAVETLWSLAAGVFLVISADLAMRLMRSHFVDHASAEIDQAISARLMEKVLGMRMEAKPESVGSFAANLRGFEQVRDIIASSTVLTLVDLPFSLMFVFVIAFISPWLTVPVVVAFVGIVTMAYVLQHRLHHLSETTYRAGAMRNATLIESLSALETIKTQGAESVIQGRWERSNEFLSEINQRMRHLSQSAMYGTAWAQQLVTILTVIVGVYLIKERQLTMGGLIAVGMLAQRALAPAGQIVGLLMQYQGARTSLVSLNGVMDKPEERPAGANFVHRSQLRGDIEFRHVSFKYPNREDAALDDVSFKVQAGERVALIGKIGSGKTTLQKLMMGLYQPTDGAVLLDGIDLRQLDPADVRRNMGYVSQDVMLFYGTLRENITLGMPYADEGALIQAAETAGLAEFVNRHPRGFDMPVGERGDSLSGGQRQSVGIARALVHNAPFLVLDEPTSAMDFSTEAQLTQRLTQFAQGKTVVLVTHRTSLLSLVNRVIVVDAGRIVADGPRDQILQALQSGKIARAS